MNTIPKAFSKRSFLALSLSGFFLGGWAALGAGTDAPVRTPPLKVGIYDSRAVAVAAVNSTLGSKPVEKAMAEYEKARQAKDEKKMAEIKSKMGARQRRQHEQGFSTASVMNWMALIQDRLPEVAKRAGVQMIVSKWELAWLGDGVEKVDVTDELIQAFGPSEKGAKWASQIQAKPPIPLDELPEHLD